MSLGRQSTLNIIRVVFRYFVYTIPDVAFADVRKFVKFWLVLGTKLIDLLEALLLNDAALLGRAALKRCVKIELRYA